jgi:hypothetical protein
MIIHWLGRNISWLLALDWVHYWERYNLHVEARQPSVDDVYDGFRIGSDHGIKPDNTILAVFSTLVRSIDYV